MRQTGSGEHAIEPVRRTAGRRRAAVALTAALAGCAAPPQAPPLQRYEPPTAGPTARLVMRGSVPAGQAYSVLAYQDAEQCAGPRTLGYGNTTLHPDTATLAAGRLTTVEFALHKPGQGSCPVRWSFVPQAGRTYLLLGNETPQGCVARLMDSTDPDRIRLESGARRRNPMGAASRCLPVAQSPLAQVVQAGAAGDDAVLRPGATADDLKGLIGGGR